MSFFDDDPLVDFDEEELSSWLAFDQLSGARIGTRRIREIFDYFGSLKEAWRAGEEELRQIRCLSDQMVSELVARRKEVEPQRLLEEIGKSGVEALPLVHPLYPTRLRAIFNPPAVLYMKGELHADDLRSAVAVVGTRKPTSYGRVYAKEIARDLAQDGVTVISGMAVGVDSLAHWGALEANGRTVAVLASGPDLCYPTSNKPLYDRIVRESGGAVISEFFPGTRPERWRFPARNRIVSGLSHAVVVVEAGASSGALITARLAFEQSREVFAVPGRIDARMSEGTNRLIAENIAHLLRSHQDVMRELNWVPAASGREVPTVVELFGREREIFELVSAEPVHFDYLCEKTGMAAGELSATLTMLELAGVVVRHEGDWYARASQSTVVEPQL